MLGFAKVAGGLGLAAIVLAASLGAQATRTVPAQYKTIQAAIDAARHGDTVLVSPGTYRENLDFRGRNIHVRSSGGPKTTTIDGRAQGSVVKFRTGEGPKAVLEGFSITNGLAWEGGGICCRNTSPTIRGNHIFGNSATGSLLCHGGGIYSSLGAPYIDRNVIHGNFVGGRGTATMNGLGGGIFLVKSNARVVNNVVIGNEARGSGSGWNWGSASGGGIYAAEGSVAVVNNVVLNNSCFDIDLFFPKVGGVVIGASLFGGGPNVLANTIIRGNRNARGPSQLGAGPKTTVTHCNIEGGYLGTGIIDADPKFGANYQIYFESPCRDRGTAAVTGLPATDHEGDPRVVFGRPDIGVDEYNYHLLSIGLPKPGGFMYIKMTGPPNLPVLWAYSVNTPLRTFPLPVPGAGNPLSLNLPIYPLPLGAMPASGEIVLSINIPASLPTPLAFPHQALVGTWLTNAEVITVTR